MSETILIGDCGSQTTQLIARGVREGGVYSEVHPYNKLAEAVEKLQPKGIIISGSPASVLYPGAPHLPEHIYKLGIPMMGFCYGQQIMVKQLGGTVVKGDNREAGPASIHITASSPLTDDVWPNGTHQSVWMSHGDKVVDLPPGFELIGSSEHSPYAIIGNMERRLYGLQCHPEVVHTEGGQAIIRNFVRQVAGCMGEWTMGSFREEAVEKVRDQVGNGQVICGLSGGVDSAVTAALIHEAIGRQLTCIMVDTGLLRMNEAAEVADTFQTHYPGINLQVRDASDLFFSRLTDVADPERKRKIIGAAFIEVFEEEARKVGGAKFLAQGTLYPDVIESVSIPGIPKNVIKSHHNVGGLPEKMGLALVEPLRTLFKDEVRALGRELGLPEIIVGRHPFPGPGMAIRQIGPVTRENTQKLQKADKIYIDEIKDASLYGHIWQAFAALLPVHTVGVMGDARTYDSAVALRAVTSRDGMTADWYGGFPPAVLRRISARITNEVPGVNRVFFDITSKPPGTIEYE